MLFAYGCRSSKKMVSEERSVMRLSGEEHLAAVIANTPDFTALSSRLKLTLPTKKGEFSVNGTLKIKRDERIQISLLIPVIRTEAARIEITPERILAIDRMNKRYVDVPVEDIKQLLGTDVDYPMLQSLFTNDIFLPGKRHLTKKDYASFVALPVDENAVLLSKKTRKRTYAFTASNETNRLTESMIASSSAAHRLRWQYNNFGPVGNTVFPMEMTIFLEGGGGSTKTTLTLSRLSVDGMELKETSIPAKYEKIGLMDLMRMIENL